MELVLVLLLAVAFSLVLAARARRRRRDPAAHIDDFRSALDRLAASSEVPVQSGTTGKDDGSSQAQRE